MTDLIVGAILLIILGVAIVYIIRAKKSGVKCIGCSPSGNCCSSSSHSDCSCECHSHTK